MNLKQVKKISKALADDHRLKILQEIKKRSDYLPCMELCGIIDLTQPSISHHVKLLQEADLIIPEKEGRNVKYTLNRKVFEEYISFLNQMKTL
jgi:ArsR family transcriptional regulator